jgi:hypothetical protein
VLVAANPQALPKSAGQDPATGFQVKSFGNQGLNEAPRVDSHNLQYWFIYAVSPKQNF